MKKYKYILLLILLTTLICTSNVYAAEKYQGMPLYRGGVLGGYEWHAGLFYSPDASYYKPIIHIGGAEDGYGNTLKVTRVEYSTSDPKDDDFLYGETFKGVYYRPGVSSSTLDNIRYLGEDLTTENISYCAFYMLEHNATGDWIYPGDIEKIRCDGVVEYCYEYYGIKLQYYYGTIREYWDISNTADCYYHSITYGMSPKNQADELTQNSPSAY